MGRRALGRLRIGTNFTTRAHVYYAVALCPSVCLSVTNLCTVETAKRIELL